MVSYAMDSSCSVSRVLMALVNSYEDTMDLEYFALRYELFSCYNHSEYFSHSLVDETKKE